MEYAEIKTKTGEIIIVDQNDYEKIKEYEWEVCKYQDRDTVFVRRVDNKRVRLQAMIGYAHIAEMSLKLEFLNGNIFDYRQSNLLLKRKWEIYKPKKINHTHVVKKQKSDFKSELRIPENDCIIKNSKKRNPICLVCDRENNNKWYKCLDAAVEMMWYQWEPKEMGQWCLRMSQLYQEERK